MDISNDKRACPYCGNTYESGFIIMQDKFFIMGNEHTVYFVECSCGDRGMAGDTKEKALENWNNKPTHTYDDPIYISFFSTISQYCGKKDFTGYYCEAEIRGFCRIEKCPAVRELLLITKNYLEEDCNEKVRLSGK